MESFIKFTGKIIGISYQGYASVVLKLVYFNVYEKTAQDNGWRKAFPPCENHFLLIPYSGAVSLSQMQDTAFAFSPLVPRTTRGFGADIESLFAGDEVEVYVAWHCSNPSCRRVVTKVIVAPKSQETQTLCDFVEKYV